MVGKMSFRMTAPNLDLFFLSSSVHIVFLIWALFCSPYSGKILPEAGNINKIIDTEKGLLL